MGIGKRHFLAAWAMAGSLVVATGASGARIETVEELCDELLSGDAELTRLQMLLEKKTGNPERAWQTEQVAACGLVPAPRLEREQRWKVAPCLADSYRTRLSTLDVFEEPPQFPSEAPASGFLHPLCLHEIQNDHGNQVSRQACNAAYRHIPVVMGIGAWRAAFPLNFSKGEVTTFGAQWLGNGPDGQEAFLIDEGYYRDKIGGTTIVLATIKGDSLAVRTIAYGGYAEQCQGGIVGASVVAGRGVAVEIADIGWSEREGLTAPGQRLPELDDFTFPTCLLRYRVLHPFDGGKLSLLSVTIDGTSVPHTEEPHINPCVAKQIRKLVGTSERTLSPAEWQRFAEGLRVCKPRE